MLVEVAQASGLDATLERYSGNVTQCGGPGKDPGHAGETTALSWPSNTSGSARGTDWRKSGPMLGLLPPQPGPR